MMNKLKSILNNWWYKTFLKWKLVYTAYKGAPWDWLYLLELEQMKLKEMKNYFEKSVITDNRNNIKWISICIKLLDIMLHEDMMTSAEEMKHYVNTRNYKRFYRLQGIPWSDVKFFIKKYPGDLRYIKATNLYYKIRGEYTFNWWD